MAGASPRALVVAFFYLWYGAPTGRAPRAPYAHWDHEVLPHWTPEVNAQHPSVGARHAPPDDIHAPFYPLRGPYSSADADTLRAQAEEAKAAGIDVLAMSWWGPSWREGATDTQGVSTDARLAEAADACAAAGVRWALHMEPYPGRTAASFREDLEYLASPEGGRLLAHPALARVAGRPLAFVYDSYHISASDWAAVLARGGASVRGTPLDVFAVGLFLERGHGAELAAGGFDAAYPYFASERMGYGAAVRNWDAMVGELRSRGMGFFPCVAPGYDDARIRPWNAAHTIDRRGGDVYRERWEGALRVFGRAGGGGGNVLGVAITSYNEWGEGTQIEPAADGVVRPAARGLPAGEYVGYGGDPYLYLNLTREYARRLAGDAPADRGGGGDELR
eukprot:PRCOL_00006141-RA